MTAARWYDIAFFIALLSTAIALGAALAHALELPNKIGLSGTEYFVVQKAYRGWNQLAYLLIVEVVSIITVVAMSRQQPYVFWPAVAAFGCLVAAQALFWIFTYPANVATENWTIMPDDWASLRRQWEYSHLAGAVAQTAAMACISLAVLARTASPSATIRP
jgi:hypothetical protein